MIEIKFLGGASEVGRSSFLVDTGVEKFLLDYGLSVQEMLKPVEPTINLDGVFLSHAHMDHSGMLPELYKRGYQKKTYMTPTTRALSLLLLKDSIKVQKKQGLEPFFDENDIEKTERSTQLVDFKEKISFTKSQVEFRDAGHIPGSSAILLDTGKKRILYTGDIKFEDTKLMKGADQNYKDIDVLITESTYAKGNHPNREILSDSLKEKIQEILYNDGIVLLPSFGVGRAQELLMLVYNLGFPVYLDGMGKEATKIVLSHSSAVRDHEELKKAFGVAYKIEKPYERNEVLKKPCVVICTSGMLTGGPIHTYIRKLHNRRDCKIILSGYQVEGTPGRKLLETKIFDSGESELEVDMDLEFMDFSAHCGRDNLIKFIEKVNPGKIIPVHGEDTEGFANDLKSMGFDSIAPKNGEVVKV